MNRLTSTWRKRHQAAQTRRAIDRALDRSSSPGMDQELMILASRQFIDVPR